MGYRLEDHTGEVAIVARGSREEDVFVGVLRAFAKLAGPGSGGVPGRRQVELAAPDRATLLVEWVNELVFLADTEGLVPDGVADLSLGADGLRAVVTGRLGAAPSGLVKAATLNDLELAPDGDGWRARVVLDV